LRIAVSGTHCSGKSTLIEAFLAVHPDFVHEPEPYVVMVEDYGAEFSLEPSIENFLRQLEFNVERIQLYSETDNVIFERSPVDFLGYILALKDLKRDDLDQTALVTTEDLVNSAMRSLDLIVFLPLDDAHKLHLPQEEDPKLRVRVDRRLIELFDRCDAALLEVRGTTDERLRQLWSAVASAARHRFGSGP
jgi:hypothetical protein